MSTIRIRQILANQFRVDEFIASGGMGAVYQVWDLKRNVPLAMKVLHDELAGDPSTFKYFQREANALKKLAHPNIVPFYGLYRAPDVVFILERFVDGPSLNDLLRRNGKQPLPVWEALAYLKALSAALGYAHANGVVHCDVKPGNVMVDQGGNIFLTDFGIARHAESTTTTLVHVGTAAYIAPEQIRGEAVSPATDVYALGIMLFEMLTGERPFKGTERETENDGAATAVRIRAAHLKLPPPDPRTMNAKIDEALAAVILKALSKEPVKRYASPREMFEAACRAAAISPVSVPDRATPPSGWNQNQTDETTKSKYNERRTSPKVKVGLLVTGGLGMVIILTLFVLFLISPPGPSGPITRRLGEAPPITPLMVGSYDGTAGGQESDDPGQPVVDATPKLDPIDPTPTDSVNESPTPLATASPRSTDIPLPTDTPVAARTSIIPACPGAIRSQILVDMRAYVCTQSDRLITKSEPHPQSQEVFRLYPGTQFKIIEGPVCTDGSNWWQIRVPEGTTVRFGQDYVLTEATAAWVREGSDHIDPYYICP